MSDKLVIFDEAQHKVLKLRIYPNTEQTTLINKTFGSCRKLYNEHLQEKKMNSTSATFYLFQRKKEKQNQKTSTKNSSLKQKKSGKKSILGRKKSLLLLCNRLEWTVTKLS